MLGEFGCQQPAYLPACAQPAARRLPQVWGLASWMLFHGPLGPALSFIVSAPLLGQTASCPGCIYERFDCASRGPVVPLL